MKAAVFHGNGDIRIEEVDPPQIATDELLLDVSAVGVCGTDAHEYSHGPSMFPIDTKHPVSQHVGPMIPGHEFVGVVSEVGADVAGFAVGDLVASGAGISCGACVQCRRGRTNLCENYSTVGLQRNGALAEQVAVPAATCRQVKPYNLAADAAALAQPMSIAVHAMRRGRLDASDEAIIIGAGGIGAFLTYAVRSITDKFAVLDIDQGRLDTASALGAPHALDSASTGPDDIAALGLNPTVVYEVSGTVPGLNKAMELLPKGGRLVLVGLQGAPQEISLRQISLVENEIIGTNAHVCNDDLPTALELLAERTEGWSDIAPVALPLDSLVDDALAPLAEGRSERIKNLIDPSLNEPRPTNTERPS